MSRPRIRVEIEELILHGFDLHQRFSIAEAVQAELAATLGDLNVPAERSVANIDAGSFTLASGADANALGRAIAHQVRRGID